MRLFVAIPISEALKPALRAGREGFRRTHGRVRWVDEANLHLTLQFLGEVGAARISDVTEACRSATVEIEPFELRYRGLGIFPPTRSGRRIEARSLWVGVQEQAVLDRLVETLGLRLEAAGFPREERPFSAHVTLGRSATRDRGVRLEELPGSEQGFGSQFVEAVELMASELRPEGARYSSVGSFLLGGLPR